MKPVSDLHAAARKWAQAAIPVFPCLPDRKQPATPNGFHDATTDLNVIDGWWNDNPDFNLAFCPHVAGLGVIDIDGPEGEQSWEDWQSSNGRLEKTYTVRTPRGGRHLYYRGVLPATQSKIGTHVDTRGVGSYALLPPSVVGGRRYVLEDSRTPVKLAPAVAEYLERLKREAIKAAVGDLDLPENVARAKRFLEEQAVAVEGHMGDNHTFVTACKVLNLGLSPDKAHELMLAWNERCVPPWDEDELLVKIENAARYAQNEAGAWAVGSSADTFGSALDKLAPEIGEDPPPKPKRRRFRPVGLAELRQRPPPEWLIPDMIPAGGQVVVYGQEKSFKSFFVAQHIALPLAQLGVSVAYVAGEGAQHIAQRIFAWQTVHECPDDIPLHMVEQSPWAGDSEMVTEFLEEMKALQPQLVVLDTAARSLVGLNENDAKDMGLFVAFMDAIRDALSCTVVAVHHTGKDASRGPRGSGALLAAVDTGLEVKADKRTKALAVQVTAMRGAMEREEPFCFEGKEVGGNLVFQPITHAEYMSMTRVNDTLAPKAIGAMLRKLGAVGQDNGVTTDVLAFEVVSEADPDLGDDAKEAAVRRQVRVLSKLAQYRLEAYCAGEGANRRWFVP